MMSVRAVNAPAMRPRRREASRSRSGGSAVPRAPVVVGPLKGLFNARMRPRGVIQLPRAQWFQPTAFRDFTIYLTFFIMMIISSASPVRPDQGGGTGRLRRLHRVHRERADGVDGQALE